MSPGSFQQLANFIWSVADLLRGPYRPPQYERVMLPLTVLRRFDAVLAPTKEAVLQRYEALRAKNLTNIDAVLNNLAKNDEGQALGFHNHSQLDFLKLKGDPDHIGRHLTDYINGFSANIRKIFERFDFEKEIEKLEEANRLYEVVARFAEIDLHPHQVDNITMGLVFEDLIRRFNEAANETAAIESVLLDAGYNRLDGKGFDRERAIFPVEVLAFIQATQDKGWKKLEALHGEQTGERVLESLCKWLDTHGTLATLRHGFKCFGRTLRVAFFRPAHGLNPDLEARYRANRLGLTRQLHFSPRSEQSLDCVLSVNGIPVIDLELKNPLTGQTTTNAIHQFRSERDPREPIFAFTKRTLAHFAVDTDEVYMTTRLAGAATQFLPFNQGADGGAGNPPDAHGGTTRPPICGRRSCNATACSICWRASCLWISRKR